MAWFTKSEKKKVEVAEPENKPSGALFVGGWLDGQRREVPEGCTVLQTLPPVPNGDLFVPPAPGASVQIVDYTVRVFSGRQFVMAETGMSDRDVVESLIENYASKQAILVGALVKLAEGRIPPFLSTSEAYSRMVAQDALLAANIPFVKQA